jgi:hypothetical protein
MCGACTYNLGEKPIAHYKIVTISVPEFHLKKAFGFFGTYYKTLIRKC